MKKALLLGAALGLAPAVALGADLPVASPPPAPVMVTYNQWAGFYGGVSVGWTGGSDRADILFPQTTPNQPGFDGDVYRGPGFLAAQTRYNEQLAVCTGGAPFAEGCTYSTFPLANMPFTGRGDNKSGGIITLNTGYNWQFGSFVVGVEGDMSFMDRRYETAFSGSGASGYQFNFPVTGDTVVGVYGIEGDLKTRSSLDWLSTARLRAGYAAGPFLLFATGGIAGGRSSMSASGSISERFRETTTNTAPPPPAILAAPAAVTAATSTTTWSASNSSSTDFGWTLGGGVEWQASPGFSLKAEYLYYDLGSNTLAVTGTTNTTLNRQAQPSAVAPTIRLRQDLNGHIFRVGINFGFAAAPRAAAPVVAAY